MIGLRGAVATICACLDGHVRINMGAWTGSGSKHLPNSLPPLPLPPPSETKQFRNEATPERWLPNKTSPPQLSPPYRGESPLSSGDTAPLVHRLLTVTSSALIPPGTKPPWTPVQRHPSIPLRRTWATMSTTTSKFGMARSTAST